MNRGRDFVNSLQQNVHALVKFVEAGLKVKDIICLQLH